MLWVFVFVVLDQLVYGVLYLLLYVLDLPMHHCPLVRTHILQLRQQLPHVDVQDLQLLFQLPHGERVHVQAIRRSCEQDVCEHDTQEHKVI